MLNYRMSAIEASESGLNPFFFRASAELGRADPHGELDSSLNPFFFRASAEPRY